MPLAIALVNPEAWALAIYLTAAYAVGEAAVSSTLLAASLFLVSGLASCYTWAVFGTGISKALRRGWRARAFNGTMGLVLVSCAIWIMLSD